VYVRLVVVDACGDERAVLVVEPVIVLPRALKTRVGFVAQVHWFVQGLFLEHPTVLGEEFRAAASKPS
jgi:hypothetical protein